MEENIQVSCKAHNYKSLLPNGRRCRANSETDEGDIVSTGCPYYYRKNCWEKRPSKAFFLKRILWLNPLSNVFNKLRSPSSASLCSAPSPFRGKAFIVCIFIMLDRSCQLSHSAAPDSRLVKKHSCLSAVFYQSSPILENASPRLSSPSRIRYTPIINVMENRL